MQQPPAPRAPACMGGFLPCRLGLRVTRAQAADPAAVAELQRVSVQTRSSRLDRAYLHRRRLRGQGGKGSRAWYVDEAAWLAGTTADATAAPNFFQEEVGRTQAWHEQLSCMNPRRVQGLMVGVNMAA